MKYVIVDEEMDGMAIVQTFATDSGPDCLKSILGTLGSRIKVYSAIKSFLSKNLYEVRSLDVLFLV